jgi:hypothetical protein
VSRPRQFSEITPAWLTSVLRDAGSGRSARISAIEIEPIGHGVGFLGQLARLRLTYDVPEPGAPASLVGKFPTLDPGGRQICQMFQFYEREVQFYRELASRMPIRVPRCYGSVMDVAADDYLILLEDLGALPMGDDATGCTAAQAERAVAAIGRVHAAWWDNAELEALPWLPVANAPVHQIAEPAYQQSVGPFLDLFGDHLSPRMRAITEKMQTHVVDLLDTLVLPPNTLTHGDYRLDNLFFDGGGVAAIDWQIAFRGHGIFDVAYFLSGSLAPAVRRAEEARLVRLWHEIAAGGDARYPFDQAFLEYRRAVLYCHVYTVIATGSLNPSNERGMAVFRAWLERRSAAIEELDAGALMPV